MARTNEAQIVYTPRPDATLEAELKALSAVYALALQKSRKSKEAAQPTAPKDAKVRSNEFRAETILHQDP